MTRARVPAARTKVIVPRGAVEPRIGARGGDRDWIDVGGDDAACAKFSPPRSPARRSRCRGRARGARAAASPAHRAPAGSRAWCRDGRCRRRAPPRSRCRWHWPARARGHARRARRSGRRAPARKPARLCATQSVSATGSKMSAFAASSPATQRDQRAHRRLVGRLAEMDRHLPPAAVALEGGADRVVRSRLSPSAPASRRAVGSSQARRATVVVMTAIYSVW